ncbi:hypothetical protein [Sorangium sp. So ce1151]|uniref:hypothetical protein n=1 Tax=Sorangium sp. So ce1151 TaxID=3133332 RepID=UPI003F6251B9
MSHILRKSAEPKGNIGRLGDMHLTVLPMKARESGRGGDAGVGALPVTSNIVEVLLLTNHAHGERRQRGGSVEVGFAANRDVLVLEFERVYGTMKRFPEPPRVPPFDCSSSVAHHPNEVLLDRLDEAHPWPEERYECAIRLWDAYADENPLPFVESCIAGVEGFPELASLWALLSCFLPRRTTEGALRLSRYDDLIFTILSVEEWQTPVRVICNKSQLGVDLRDLVSCTGDLFWGDRLVQWAKHGSSAAVESAPGPKPPDYPLLSQVYRLIERGMRLRDKGLDQLKDAPSLPIAGTEAHSPSAPWVLLEDGQLARL